MVITKELTMKKYIMDRKVLMVSATKTVKIECKHGAKHRKHGKKSHETVTKLHRWKDDESTKKKQ